MRILKTILKYLLAVFFVLGGTYHILKPAFYLQMMPPYLPWHHFLVFFSGLYEIGLGLLVLVPRFTWLAGWGLIALLVAIFPANLHMALHPEYYPQFNPHHLWLRLPLQLVFIAWVYWVTRCGNCSEKCSDRRTHDGSKPKSC